MRRGQKTTQAHSVKMTYTRVQYLSGLRAAPNPHSPGSLLLSGSREKNRPALLPILSQTSTHPHRPLQRKLLGLEVHDPKYRPHLAIAFYLLPTCCPSWHPRVLHCTRLVNFNIDLILHCRTATSSTAPAPQASCLASAAHLWFSCTSLGTAHAQPGPIQAASEAALFNFP